MKRIIFQAVLPILFCLVITPAVQAEGWKAAAGSVVITPEHSMWMAGYAARNKPSEGVAQDLKAKALILEDEKKTRLAIVTLDLIGIPRGFREDVVSACREKYQLPPESILLNASHTHCGPELRVFKIRHYGVDAAREAQAIEYTRGLKGKIVTLIGRTLKKMQPVTLESTHGRAGFAMNRRLPTERGVINSPYPEGPVDHEVPVLKVLGEDGKLEAVLFGYACHNTTLSYYQFSGDYAGYAQDYLEAAHPGVTCLFAAGCGADQNPYPRRTQELAQQHGRPWPTPSKPPSKPASQKKSTGRFRLPSIRSSWSFKSRRKTSYANGRNPETSTSAGTPRGFWQNSKKTARSKPPTRFPSRPLSLVATSHSLHCPANRLLITR